MKKIDKIIIGVGGTIIAAMIGSLGVMIYQQAVYGVPVRDNIDEVRVNEHNSQFNQFIGIKKGYKYVMSLLETVDTNNSNANLVSEYGIINLKGITDRSQLSSNKTYTVEITEYNEYGAISEITITESEENSKWELARASPSVKMRPQVLHCAPLTTIDN